MIQPYRLRESQNGFKSLEFLNIIEDGLESVEPIGKLLGLSTCTIILETVIRVDNATFESQTSIIPAALELVCTNHFQQSVTSAITLENVTKAVSN